MRSTFVRRKLVPSACLMLLAALVVRPLLAYTPESPEVQAIVNRGIAFLERTDRNADPSYKLLGGTCLTGLAIYKWTGEADHPLVQAAAAACRTACQGDLHAHDNYSVGIALIFLCDLNPSAAKREIEILLAELFRRQKPHGGWGYPEQATGDTSQHQYAVLGSWMADRHGFDVPVRVKENGCNWLIRVQDPNGSYGYQGNDPGNYQRVAQTAQSLSLQAAAMGSLYVSMDMLGLGNIESDSGTPQADKDLPNALKRRGEKNGEAKKKENRRERKKRTGPITNKVSPVNLKRALDDGNTYFDKAYQPENGQYQHYYMYAMERYKSFLELAERTRDDEPRWYNDGVNLLRASQKPNGGWSRDSYGPMVDTSFACLFLMRSTRRMIRKVIEESGTLIGGRDLPDDLTEVKQARSGKIIAVKETPPVEELLAMLEDQNTPGSDFLDGVPDQLKLTADPAKRAEQIARLRRLAISGPFQARLTAVQTLSRHRDLDNVPALIFAVTDPDARVSRAATEGLRFISRKFDGPIASDAASEQQKKVVAAAWKEWYLGVRPDGALIE